MLLLILRLHKHQGVLNDGVHIDLFGMQRLLIPGKCSDMVNNLFYSVQTFQDTMAFVFQQVEVDLVVFYDLE